MNNEKPRLLQNRDSHFTQLEEEAHQANKNIKKLQIDIENLEVKLSLRDLSHEESGSVEFGTIDQNVIWTKPLVNKPLAWIKTIVQNCFLEISIVYT